MINAYETSGNSPTGTFEQQAENQLINSLRSDLKALNASSLIYTLEDAARTVRRLSETKTTLDALSHGWREHDDGPWGSIYAIVPEDSTNHIVYVGQTTNLILRIAGHFITGESGTCMFVNEHPSQLLILEDGIDRAQLTERENYWMCDFWGKGYNLVNRKVPTQLKHERVACYGKAPTVPHKVNMLRVTVRNSDADVVIPLIDPLFELAPVMLSWLRRTTIAQKAQEVMA